MAALYLNDAGTWRQIQKVHVNDAGTWRQVQKVYVNDAGTWRQVYSFRAPESGSLGSTGSGNEVGASTVNFGNGIHGTISGWPGSLGSNRLTDEVAIITIAEDVIAHTTIVRLQPVSGTLAQDYFSSLTANGNTILTSAASYSFSSGRGIWTWAGQLLGLVSGSTIPVTINF